MREKEKQKLGSSAATVAASHIRQIPEWLDAIDDFLVQQPLVDQVAVQVGVRPCYMIPISFSVAMLFVGWFDAVITNGVGFFYPAWQSFKAVETKRTDDDKQWLTYWVVFAAFSVVEMFSNVLLFWIPFYYVLKISFLLWLALPQFQGAKFVYNKAVQPFLLSHEKKIDGVVERLNGQAQQAAQTAQAAMEGLRKRIPE
eukprot:CAMPEP_0113846768 /NCGR_PEP_ID=MMETSP0372-20130328/1492_1 /TAXON_ID=340204 /ORGANISM="Lankesteria abbotti" /LENGTH=198 /DNA_ID=CAMNT_0000815951 /DNA_START=150 /DNA_END=746 /DNA_ORIENTATION=+ /assembly_acc=CAM_ASM_000359